MAEPARSSEAIATDSLAQPRLAFGCACVLLAWFLILIARFGTCSHDQSERHTTDAPHRRAVLQVAGRHVDISIQEEWGQRAPSPQIVAIGAADSIDADLLEKTSASCISPAAAST
jgi:hypothetical protein